MVIISAVLRCSRGIRRALVGALYDQFNASRKRMAYRSWLDMERASYATNGLRGDYDLRVVEWTIRTSLPTCVDNLAPCLLETFEPGQALLGWVSRPSKSTHRDIMARLADGWSNEFYYPSNQVLHPLVFPLVEYTYQHARDAQLGIHFWKNPKAAELMRFVHGLMFNRSWCRNPRPQTISRGWLCLSHAISGFDPVKFSRDAVSMMEPLLNRYQQPKRPGADEPITSAFQLSVRLFEMIFNATFPRVPCSNHHIRLVTEAGPCT